MLVKYYKNKDLSYANRKRFTKFNFSCFSEEEQKSILLGDGANTTIKTKKSNICDYVTIDGTRWFVTSYTYCNGGQVNLNLQRDVIGEFGLDGCFGKIERGYTESILRNRKELGLNQILKDRKKIYPSNNKYGNYSVDSHENEMWGILYFTKSNTSSSVMDLNIPEFNPDCVDYDFIESGTSLITDVNSFSYIRFNLTIDLNNCPSFACYISFMIKDGAWTYEKDVTFTDKPGYGITPTFLLGEDKKSIISSSDMKKIAERICDTVANDTLSNKHSTAFKLPPVQVADGSFNDYDGAVIKNNGKFYSYSTTKTNIDSFGTAVANKTTFYNKVLSPAISNPLGSMYTFGGENFTITFECDGIGGNTLGYESKIISTRTFFKNVEIPASEAGQFVIDVSQNLVDEPFVVIACPLYDVKITGKEDFNILKKKAFNYFNTLIQSLSGENGVVIDAQIYPYCPVITDVAFKLFDYPFFKINSTTYTHECFVDLRPDVNIKKEYIERVYSIVSPEQSGKFDFNYYDYKTKITEEDGKNSETIKISVKTALKPFNIISSAVVVPDLDSLKGKTYESDLRGCQPSGNGFQCSMASNAFETYKRQNSNYQQIFALQKRELSISHNTEKVNEITNGVVSSLTAGLMGTMAGAASADGFWGDFVHSQAIGGAAGGITAAASVATAQAVQLSQNNKLREFEKAAQQQRFDLEIGTIKNIPNSVNRISSFNEIILKDFCYVVEIYECSDAEKDIVDNFISNYSYGIGVFDLVSNYVKNGWFIRSTLVRSSFHPNLHNIASNELMGGIYIYE